MLTGIFALVCSVLAVITIRVGFYRRTLPDNSKKGLNMPAIKSNKLYDRLKFLAQIFLPALGALYFGLAGIWGFPAADEVVGTIAIVDTFLGVFLSASSAKYQSDPDGVILPDGQLSLKQDSVYDKDQLLIKVHRE